MDDRSYMSIGEVLALLKEEFPDATISKIRFLESQGLLDPERTPSGYRKFYEPDVERLRWILRQQREHFLPLKVIKGRLRGDADDDMAAAAATDHTPKVATASDGRASEMAARAMAPTSAATAAASASAAEATGPAAGSERPSPPAPVERPPAPSRPAASRPASRYPFASESDLKPLTLPSAGVSMSLGELAAASGLEEDDLRDLERFGLLSGRRVGSTSYYDEDALNVAHLAAGFMRYGVEARHLRMYKTAGEREAGFFEQLITPMLKQRNPEARRQATEALADLSRLGQGLRAAMLRQALREYFDA